MSGGAFRYRVALSVALGAANCRWRPYRVECTGSLPTSEVKRRRARLVLGWGTAREDLRVLPAFCFNRAVLRLGSLLVLCVGGCLVWRFVVFGDIEAEWRSG